MSSKETPKQEEIANPQRKDNLELALPEISNNKDELELQITSS